MQYKKLLIFVFLLFIACDTFEKNKLTIKDNTQLNSLIKGLGVDTTILSDVTSNSFKNTTSQ